MMWILIIVIGGGAFNGGISDVKPIQMTEAQCKRTVIELKLYKDHIGAGCFGPEGQKFTFDDVVAMVPEVVFPNVTSNGKPMLKTCSI